MYWVSSSHRLCPGKVTLCCHFWLLEENKVVAKGVCRACGEWRRFNPKRRFAKTLAKKLFVAFPGTPAVFWVYVTPRDTSKKLANIAGVKLQVVLGEQGTLAKDTILFEHVRSGELVMLVPELPQPTCDTPEEGPLANREVLAVA